MNPITERKQKLTSLAVLYTRQAYETRPSERYENGVLIDGLKRDLRAMPDITFRDRVDLIKEKARRFYFIHIAYYFFNGMKIEEYREYLRRNGFDINQK